MMMMMRGWLLKIRWRTRVWMIDVECGVVCARVDDLFPLPLLDLLVDPAMTRMFPDRRIG